MNYIDIQKRHIKSICKLQGSLSFSLNLDETADQPKLNESSDGGNGIKLIKICIQFNVDLEKKNEVVLVKFASAIDNLLINIDSVKLNLNKNTEVLKKEQVDEVQVEEQSIDLGHIGVGRKECLWRVNTEKQFDVEDLGSI